MSSAVAVANFFVELGRRDDVSDLSGNKLQDLVYLAHGWFLGAGRDPLLEGPVCAQRDGVVVPALSDAGCVGGKRILRPLAVFELDEVRGVMVERTPSIDATDAASPPLHRIWARWGGVPAYELHEFTREHGSPWDLIWNDEARIGDAPCRIPTATLRLWFRGWLARDVEARQLECRLGDTQAVLAQPDPNRLRSV